MASAPASREMGTDEDKSTLKPSQQDGAVGTAAWPLHWASSRRTIGAGRQKEAARNR